MNAIHTLISKAAVAAFALIAPLVASADDVYFPNDATINYRIPGAAILGYANVDDFYNFTNPTRPTISFIEGAETYTPYADLVAAGGTNLTMTGGIVGNDLFVTETSVANISGGSIGRFLSSGGDFYGTGPSVVNVSGGTVGLGLMFGQDSVVNISGGTFGNPTDGLISSVEGTNCTLNLSGGLLYGDLNAFDGNINVTGGTMQNVVVGDGLGNIYGGNIGGYIAVTRTGTITVYGSDLALTLIDPEFYDGFISLYSLNGRLQDGTQLINKEVWVGNLGANFVLVNASAAVPEPGAFVLGIASVSVIALRRKRRA